MALDFISNNPLLFHGFVILASLAIMTKASDLAVYGVSRYSFKLGISDYLVGILSPEFQKMA